MTEVKKPAAFDYTALLDAAASDNQAVDKSFERELAAEGLAFVRLVGYVETGRHKPKNPAHKPSLGVILTFELSHPKHLIEIDGKKVHSTIQVRKSKGATSKSGFKKLFKSLDHALGGGHKHIVEMIGKPCKATIYHNKTGEGDKEQTYANFDMDNAFSFASVTSEDEYNPGQMKTIPVPEMTSIPQVFLWEPTRLTPEGDVVVPDEVLVGAWDALHIEGEREVKKGDEVTMVSKNWLQELIKSNIEWDGSYLQGLVEEHVELDELGGLISNEEDLPQLDKAEDTVLNLD